MTHHKTPTGWKEIKLGKHVTIFNGGAFSSSDAAEKGVRWLKIANIGVGIVKWEDESFLPDTFLETYKKYKLGRGDIILALTRPTLGNNLKIAEIKEEDEDSLLNQRVGKLVFNEYIDKKLVYYFLRTEESAYRINQQLAGTDPPNLSSHVLKLISFLLPPLPEQHRIVSVLETWDKAIEKLEQKIHIKKQIKKGLMQKLLTGKVRLPGFTEEWETVKLGELCEIKTGKKDVNEGNPDGEYPFFTCAKKHTYSDHYSFDTEAILIAGNGEVGNCQYYKGKFEAYQRTYILSEFKIGADFLFAYLRHFFQNFVSAQKQMGAMPYIKLGMLTDFLIQLPKSNAEQTAIARILTTADTEIETLEKKLSLLQEQKKYLLNNLITGKIRTPENMREKKDPL